MTAQIQFDEDVYKVLDMTLAGSLHSDLRRMTTIIYRMRVDRFDFQVHKARYKLVENRQRTETS